MSSMETAAPVTDESTERPNAPAHPNGQTPDDVFPVTVRPMDEHNRALLTNAHPPGWQNPPPSGRYNLIAIGAGTAGLVATIGGAGLGAKTALIERNLMGGDCLNWGCVPSKSIIRPARVVGEIRQGRSMGVHAPDPEINFGQIMARMRRVRADISQDDSVQRVQDEGVDLFLGNARFVGPNTVEVDYNGERQTLDFAKAVITTGSRPRLPNIPGLSECDYLTNETIFQLTEQPRRLAVLGGGPIGSEMAQTFARLGTDVTVLELADQIMIREDPDAARVVQEALVRDGVTLVLKAMVKSVDVTDNGCKVIHYEHEGEQKQCEVDALLISVGRTPNVESLNLEAAGVDYTARGVVVDDTLQTTNPNIYAAGDVAFKYQFTHAADATARIVLQNALFPLPKKKASDLVMPWCTYTDPEVAHVGLHENQAREQGIAVETFIQSLGEVDRGKADGETEGFVKIHIKKGSDEILGATIVASHAGEMINEITTAMVGGVGLKTLASVIHPYPTQSEAIKKIADAYNRTRLTPFVKQLFTRWLAWQR